MKRNQIQGFRVNIQANSNPFPNDFWTAIGKCSVGSVGSVAKKKYTTFFQGRLGSKNEDLETILHTRFDI